MEDRPPRELLGAIGGAVGAIALLPIVHGFAFRFVAPPVLPGAQMRAADIKAATYLEAAVFLLAMPVAALFFGCIVPGLLKSRSGCPPALSGTPGAAFALSAALWRLGAAPVLSLAAGILSSAGLAAALLLLGDRPAFRRFLEEPNRSALVRIAAAGIAWGLAARSARFHESLTVAALGETLLVAAVLLSLSALRKAQRRRHAEA